MDVAAGSTLTIQGSVSTTGTLTLPNSGTVTFANGGTINGVTFSKNGTLKAGSGNGSITFNGNIVSDNNNTGVATINGNVNFGGTRLANSPTFGTGDAPFINYNTTIDVTDNLSKPINFNGLAIGAPAPEQAIRRRRRNLRSRRSS
jgi:hypothetical protein